jgi:hypothetical protein
MITELNVVDPNIIPGRKIDVVEYHIQNYRLHQVLEQIARLFLFLLECDSNNTASKMRPRDARRVLAQWAVAKDEMVFGMEHNDLPAAIYEYGFSVNLPSGKEIQKIRNVKIKRVYQEIFNTARQILSVDSAHTQSFVAAEDHGEIMEWFNTVDLCLSRWIGDGTEANTGVLVPAYEELGVVSPDVDSDYASVGEPSADAPVPKLPSLPNQVKK